MTEGIEIRGSVALVNPRDAVRQLWNDLIIRNLRRMVSIILPIAIGTELSHNLSNSTKALTRLQRSLTASYHNYLCPMWGSQRALKDPKVNSTHDF